jgi:hypothetical protein
MVSKTPVGARRPTNTSSSSRSSNGGGSTAINYTAASAAEAEAISTQSYQIFSPSRKYVTSSPARSTPTAPSTSRTSRNSRSSSRSSTPIDWRDDRFKSKSDWTIHIVHSKDGNGARRLYYVHTKVIDELTTRRIPYFEPIFKDSMKQIGDRTSELYMPSDLLFDALLDFLYCANEIEEEDFLFNVKNGLSLYKIAEYFKIRSLQSMLCDFYRQTTMPFNVTEYLDGSGSGSASKTLQVRNNTREMLHSGIEDFAKKMHTLDDVEEEKLDPTFLLKALKKRRKELKIPQTKKESENISCLVALSTKHYKNKLTRSIFYKLTQEAYIPFIDQEAALQLLTVESELQYWYVLSTCYIIFEMIPPHIMHILDQCNLFSSSSITFLQV